MATNGIEEGTPIDKAGTWPLVFWLLEVSVGSQAHAHPLLKAPRPSRVRTLAHALEPVQGSFGSNAIRPGSSLVLAAGLELTAAGEPGTVPFFHPPPISHHPHQVIKPASPCLLDPYPGSPHLSPAQQSQCRLLADKCPVEARPSAVSAQGSHPAQTCPSTLLGPTFPLP